MICIHCVSAASVVAVSSVTLLSDKITFLNIAPVCTSVSCQKKTLHPLNLFSYPSLLSSCVFPIPVLVFLLLFGWSLCVRVGQEGQFDSESQQRLQLLSSLLHQVRIIIGSKLNVTCENFSEIPYFRTPHTALKVLLCLYNPI